MTMKENKMQISPIEEVIDDAKMGKLFILVDDEDRENEGDICIIGDFATPESINFMAKYGRGLICLAITSARAEELGLSLMERRNENRHQTAFTISIEAREGVTTGISAQDRAHTIRTAIDPQSGAGDITTPGHIFPLIARDGGTLVRAGHTEAVVDIARAAGAGPSGVICEIMKDDGTMARLPDLIEFAQEHDLRIGAIADLIAWRRQNEKLVSRRAETMISTEIAGDWRLVIYHNDLTNVEHIVLIKGDIDTSQPVLVRMHALDLMVDLLNENTQMRNPGDLHQAMRQIDEEGSGVIVLLRESNAASLSHLLAKRIDPDAQNVAQELRDYGVGAQILADLDIRHLVLLSNSRPNVVGLEGYGLTIEDWRQIKQD